MKMEAGRRLVICPVDEKRGIIILMPCSRKCVHYST